MTIRLKADGGERSMLLEDFEERVRRGQLAPEVPVFSPAAGDFVPAGTLPSYREACLAPSTRLARVLSRRGLPLVTTFLIGLQLDLYLWSLIPGFKGPLVMALADWGPLALEERQSWRLLSHALIHSSLSHLLVNTVFLAWAAWNIERALGRLNLVVLFLAGVAWSGAVSVLVAPGQPILGSSAGSFTLLAACVVVGWRYRHLLQGRARSRYGNAALPFLAVPLASGLSSWEILSWGHFAGVAVGALLGSFMIPPVLRPARRRGDPVALLATAATILMLAAVAATGPWLAGRLR
jgi:membrane associated rhomboid family serine protease